MFLSFGAVLPLAAFDPAVPPTQRSAVLVSWDGVGRERLHELLAAGRLPGVSALVRGGSLVNVDVTDHRTDTKAGNLGSAGPDFLRRGQPWHLVRPSLTVWDGDASRDASVVGQLALACLRRFAGQRFFAFFHFGDADRAGHQEGERSASYAEAIVASDRWLIAIAAELRALGVDRTTMVFVTADHGFDPASRGHREAPRVFLATDNPAVVRDGDQRDIVPTLLAELGADPAAVRPTLAGRPLTSIGLPEIPAAARPADPVR